MSSSAPSVDEILGSVASALRGDRSKVRGLVKTTRKRLIKQAKTQLKKEVDSAIAELRGVQRKQKKSRKKPTKRKAPSGARLAPPKPLPPLSPRNVRLRLPNQRVVRGRIRPQAARRNDVAALRKVLAANNRSAFAAISHNARSIDALAKSQRDIAKLLAELQGRGDLTVLKGIVEALAGLELKCIRGLKRQRKSMQRQNRRLEAKLTRHRKATRRALAMQKRTAQIQKLNVAAGNLQFAAFGQPGSMTNTNNVRLTATTVATWFARDILDALGLTGSSQTAAIEWLTPVVSTALGRAVAETADGFK